MSIISKVKKVVFKIIKIIYKLFYKYVKVDNNLVLFIAYHGKGYLCNPKYIHEYMINNEEYSNYKFIWAVKNKKDISIPNSKVVRYNGLLYFYYLARSKYWIFNCKMPKYILKKENQIYLQTWHGTPLKRLAHDIEIGDDKTFYRSKMSREEMKESYDIDVARYNYFISPNNFSTEKFKSAFKVKEDIIIETGYPRNDFITNIKDEEIIKIKEKYNIPLDKKVILYAPTWRDNSFNNKGYTFELKVDFNLWKKTLGNEFVVIFKPHYLIVNKYKNDNLNGFLYSIDENEDINNLYVISDILVTDYSSVFFDYSILKRPIYFYMYDLEEYKEDLRGFYLNIYKDLPGDIIEDENDLVNKLKNHKLYLEENINKLNEFNSIYNSFQDGNCSEKVTEILFKKQDKKG